MYTLYNYKETNQYLCHEILEKTRTFYQQHFLPLDAAFGAQPKALKMTQTAAHALRPYVRGFGTKVNMAVRIRLLSTAAMKQQPCNQPRFFWMD